MRSWHQGARWDTPVVIPLAVVLLAAVACGRDASRPGTSIRIAVPYEVTTLDPHAETKLGNLSVLSNVYEPLVTTDADMRIRPCLAGTWESPDSLTWVFHLRPSVRFHSGRPLRAADVVYTLERVIHSEDLAMRGSLHFSEIRALDDLSVQIRTTAASRIFMSKLSVVLIVSTSATTSPET